MTELTLAAVAPETVLWDKGKNFQTAERALRRAASAGADLAVLYEGFLEGWVVDDPEATPERFLEAAEPDDGEYVRAFQALSRELSMALVLGLAERVGDDVYNSAIFIGDDGVTIGKYHKTHLRGHDAEARLYREGDSLPVFETKWGPTGIMICYDRQVPEVARVLRIKGARLLLVPSNGGYGERNEVVVRARAYENAAFLVFSHPKEGLILDPRGHVVARKAMNEEFTLRTIDLDYADECLNDSPGGRTLDSRRPELYRRLAE
jgi:predicted amidohydrolase